MELYIAGGCSEHGRNCFLVTADNITYMVDCGYIKGREGLIAPMLSREQISRVRYLFITHGHMDHGGALDFLYANGFDGRVILTGRTEQMLKTPPKKPVYPEKCRKSGEWISLDREISFMWGRSGHCMGSVWYLIRTGNKTVFFSGDYTEESVAYQCDRVRNVSADAAVIDVAYAREKDSAAAHRKQLRERLREAKKKDEILLLPVPHNGRGMDLVRYLTEEDIPVYADEELLNLFHEKNRKKSFLRKKLRQILKKDQVLPLEKWTEKDRAAALLVADSQLAGDENRQLAARVKALGGSVLFTGRTKSGTTAEKMVQMGNGEFRRISVHQNVDEMKRLTSKNKFGLVIPNHTEQTLEFHKKRYHILKAGDKIQI